MSSLIFNFNFTTHCGRRCVCCCIPLFRAMFGVQLLTPLLSLLIFSPFSMEKHYASVHDGDFCLFLLQQALSLCCSDIPYAAYRNISHVPTVLSCIQHLSSLTKLTHFNYEEDLLMCKGCLMPPRDCFYKCSF